MLQAGFFVGVLVDMQHGVEAPPVRGVLSVAQCQHVPTLALDRPIARGWNRDWCRLLEHLSLAQGLMTLVLMLSRRLTPGAGPGFLEVSGVKTLGAPAVDRCQQLPGLSALALLLPQVAQAHGGPQLSFYENWDGLTVRRHDASTRYMESMIV